MTEVHTITHLPSTLHGTTYERPSYKDHNTQLIYQSLSVTRRLNNSKFPVYLVFSKITKQRYAMKIFPFSEDKPSDHFSNEIRFSLLKHPNIINFVYCEQERETIHKGVLNKSSYILLEYASHGDFFKFIIDHKDQIDEKLARTYFRQLIAGIEYLHENGVAHLDLKPENLLIGDDYSLKIIDFDLSYAKNDTELLSHGTKRCRGPEFFRSTYSRLEPKDVFAADIYSAGVVLFLLKSGGFYPHGENDSGDAGSFEHWMYTDNKLFWEKHLKMVQRESSFYDKSFKELFNSMMKEKPSQRASLKQIKKSKWYKGPVYSPSELSSKMNKIFENQELK